MLFVKQPGGELYLSRDGRRMNASPMGHLAFGGGGLLRTDNQPPDRGSAAAAADFD